MDGNLLSSYSFLASLNENRNDLYNAVYIPICKRAISLFAKENTSGTDEEIQAIIKKEYNIEIPLVVTRKLICLVFDDLSRKDRKNFNIEVFEGGRSFKFNSFHYNFLEDSYKRESRNANALQIAFETYVKECDISISSIPSFASFILKYKNNLSSFLSGKTLLIEDAIEEKSYMLHARFLQFIEKNDDKLYKVAQRIFVGSIIASYIESEIDIVAKPSHKISYILDTKVILNALDLQNEECTRPTKELLSLIEKTNGEIIILDITLAEIHSIIDAAISSFNKDAPTSTINEACVRKNKSRTWLVQFNSNLESIILNCIKATFYNVPESEIKQYLKSEDLTLLKKIWFRKNAAEHDVISYLHVRNRRKSDSNKKIYHKASCWFVTENKKLCDFNISQKINGFANEVILPQELTSLLFLQNPQKYMPSVADIGLSELIAQTITEEYPSTDIINEFDAAIKEHTNISSGDYEILASEISKFSTNRLQNLLGLSVSTPEDFRNNIYNMILKARKKQRKDYETNQIERERNEKEIIELKLYNKELIEKIEDISNEYIEFKSHIAYLENKKNRQMLMLAIFFVFVFILIQCVQLICDKTNMLFSIVKWLSLCSCVILLTVYLYMQKK